MATRETAPALKFKVGDFVAVATTNGGRIVQHERQRVVETWAARIIAPSVMGDGWWLVRAVDPATGHVLTGSRLTTVPESEMSR